MTLKPTYAVGLGSVRWKVPVMLTYRLRLTTNYLLLILTTNYLSRVSLNMLPEHLRAVSAAFLHLI